MSLVFRVLKDEQAQGLVEYSLIIALVAVVAVVALQVLGANANTKLQNAATNLQ